MSDTIFGPEYLRAVADNMDYQIVRDIVASHEALRSRLAEAEAERDRKAKYAENMDALASERWTESAAARQAQARAEAALAEAVELLRDLIDSPDDIDPRLRYVMLQPDREDVAAARAFVEAHGSSPAGG